MVTGLKVKRAPLKWTYKPKVTVQLALQHFLQCQPFCTWEQQEAFFSNWKTIAKSINKIKAAKKDKRIPLALGATNVCTARSIYQSGSKKQKSTVIISLGRYYLAVLLIACLLLKKRGLNVP